MALVDHQPSDPSRMSLYWKCQIAGWSFYGLLASGIPILYGGLRWMVLVRAATGITIGIVLTEGLRRYIRGHGWPQLPLRRLVPRIAAASLVVTSLMVLMLLPLLLAVLSSPSRAGPLTAIYSIHLVMVLGWILLYLGYHYVHRVRTAETEKWRLELAMRDTELRALRAQLNPHFLFNSLNSLRALVTEDPGRAKEAITGLAALLRHTLQLSRTRTTTIRREMEATEHYLELEALRFESRLRYEISVDPTVLEHSIPPMLIQTLVENAIKHGIAPLPEGGAVRIAVQKRSDGLHIHVRNTGTLARDPNPRGIGLANSLERLRLIFGDRVTLRLQPSGLNDVTCEVVVPPPAGLASAILPKSHAESGAP
jgi:sensor histidine kinase YesM